MLQVDVDDLCERGVAKLMPVGQFMLVEPLVVVGLHILDNVVVRVTGLDDDLTLLVGSAGTARYLFQHVKGALMAAEVWKVDHRVGIEDAHDAHGVKVKALGHHLGAYQDIGAALRELVNDAVITVLAARGVQIHARDLLTGEYGLDVILDALGPVPDDFYTRQLTGWTQVGKRYRIAAVVAHQAVVMLVIGERHIAVFTLRNPAALFAAHHGRVASTILEQNHLFVIFQSLTAIGDEFIAEQTAHFTPLAGIDGVNDFHIGHFDVAIAGEQSHKAILPLKGKVIDLDSGGR